MGFNGLLLLIDASGSMGMQDIRGEGVRVACHWMGGFHSVHQDLAPNMIFSPQQKKPGGKGGKKGEKKKKGKEKRSY